MTIKNNAKATQPRFHFFFVPYAPLWQRSYKSELP